MSKVTISTNVLNDLVSRAVKVCHAVECGLDGYMELKVVNKVFYVTTSDNIYTMTLNVNDVNCDDFHAVVSAKFFSQLIGKLTSPNTSLSLEGNSLIVEGNGKYNVSLIFDGDGSPIEFPIKEFDYSVPVNNLTNNDIKSILTLSKSCKHKTRVGEAYYNYYMDSVNVLTFSNDGACVNPIKVFEDPTLVPPELMDLVPHIADNNGVKVYKNGQDIVFVSDMGSLYGVIDLAFEPSSYKADAILTALNEKLNYTAKVNRTLLLNAIDRICLFTQILGNNVITTTFTNEGISLKSESTKSEEIVKFLQVIDGVEPITVKLDGNTLKELISSCNREDITLNFGSTNELQVMCDNIKQVMTFFEEG